MTDSDLQSPTNDDRLEALERRIEQLEAELFALLETAAVEARRERQRRRYTS